MAAVVAVVNNDPSRPRALWAIDNAPHEWFGHVFPGAAVAIDNPDNVNRTLPLDGAWSTNQWPFWEAADRTDELHRDTGRARTAAFGQRDCRLDQSGSSGRPRWPFRHHLGHASRGGAKQPYADRPRCTNAGHPRQPFRLAAASNRDPDRNLPRTRGATCACRGRAGSARCPSIVEFVAFWLEFKNTFWETPPFNHVIGPLGRDGGWGYQAGGRFKLTDDEALVITTLVGDAAYTACR